MFKFKERFHAHGIRHVTYVVCHDRKEVLLGHIVERLIHLFHRALIQGFKHLSEYLGMGLKPFVNLLGGQNLVYDNIKSGVIHVSPIFIQIKAVCLDAVGHRLQHLAVLGVVLIGQNCHQLISCNRLVDSRITVLDQLCRRNVRQQRICGDLTQVIPFQIGKVNSVFVTERLHCRNIVLQRLDLRLVNYRSRLGIYTARCVQRVDQRRGHQLCHQIAVGSQIIHERARTHYGFNGIAVK